MAIPVAGEFMECTMDNGCSACTAAVDSSLLRQPDAKLCMWLLCSLQPPGPRCRVRPSKCNNSSSSPAILVPFGRIDNLDEALNLAELRIACGVHFLHSSNVHKGAQHVPEDRNIGDHQTCWEEIVEDPAALQSPTSSTEDTDWKRH
jgi:hypothetical protein